MNKNHIIIAVVLMLALQVAVLYGLGRTTICPCGYVKIFDAALHGTENSQHLLDWYSIMHFMYGMILYLPLVFVSKKTKIPVAYLFLVAIAISVGWEIFENTRYGINQYQANTISLDYYGDSVINSFTDTACIALGFVLGSLMPLWVTTIAIICLDAFIIVTIHDGFLIDIIMLVHPIKTILVWQGG